MSDRNLTLLELHFDGGLQIGPRTIGRGQGGDDESEDESVEVGDDESEELPEVDVEVETDEGGGVGRSLLLLVALVVLGIVARRLMGDDFEEPEFEEIEQEFDADAPEE
jgi:hypothetical protein